MNKEDLSDNNNNSNKNTINSEQSNTEKDNNYIEESERNYIKELNIYNSTPLPFYNDLINENDNVILLNIGDLENIKLDEFNEKKLKYPRTYGSDTKKCGSKYFLYRYLKNNKGNEEENIHKKKYFFLITIEKSIFYFNFKKYDECINLLLNEKIIYNKIEFGEFLLVINGFDKNIITEFLSDNNNKEILDNFLCCIYMDINICPLSNTLRFFLSSLNFPNKEIISNFSLKYFNLNKDSEIFIKKYKSLDIFSSLINNIISVNNLLIGKDKEKSNFIKIDQFVKINKNIEKKLCQSIYKDIQSNPIYPLDNYIQKMYRKLSSLVKEFDEREILDKSDDIDSYYENILNDNPKREYPNYNIWFSFRKKISSFEKEDKEILSKPINLIKYSNNSTSSKPQVLAITDNFTNLVWAKKLEGDKMKGNLHSINIEDIFDIYVGVSHSEAMQKYLKNNLKELEKELSYLTIKTNTDVIVIKVESINFSLKLYKAFKSLLNKLQNIKNKEKERTIENTKNKIENAIQKVWKTCIYTKWTQYGRYLLYKKQNKIEYKKNIFSQNNKKDKMIKSDLIDDKMNFNSKKIMNFMNGIKSKIIGEGKEESVLDYNEFLFLYRIGLPHPCRHILWNSLIENSCGTTKDLYEYYSQQIEYIDFNEKRNEYNDNKGNFISNDENDELINRIIIDILKTEDLFINELYILKNGKSETLYQIYRIVRVFFMIRKDINYNISVINYAFIFILVFNDEYTSFQALFNFICTTNIIKYLIKDESYIKNNCHIFQILIKKYIPKIYEHLNNLDINNELYTISWFENLFTQTLNYKIILRIFDLYLIYGDELLFQIGLTIIKIQEEDLLNYTIDEIFKVLKRLPNKYDEELFFENLEMMNIQEKYNSLIVSNNLSEQKDFLSGDKTTIY